jgi:hypothetical protein
MLLAVALFLAGVSALEAQQRGNAKRYYNSPKTYFYNTPKTYLYSAPRVESECQRRAQAEDPTGQYAGYPCWAREIFGRGQSGGGRD